MARKTTLAIIKARFVGMENPAIEAYKNAEISPKKAPLICAGIIKLRRTERRHKKLDNKNINPEIRPICSPEITLKCVVFVDINSSQCSFVISERSPIISAFSTPPNSCLSKSIMAQ